MELLGSSSKERRSGYAGTYAIQGRDAGQVDAVHIVVAPGEVCDLHRRQQAPQETAVALVNVQSTLSAAVEIAFAIDLQAVGNAGFIALRLREKALVGQAAVRFDVENMNIEFRAVIDV